ncbi:MAG TPA: acyl-CoA dehydrogenase family protein, partial [Candidatus Thermoplasmatota archaeon]|nr:acyl-CoA dehydrogenase family protein [Candidatus Thermoplasmatota archaeon]
PMLNVTRTWNAVAAAWGIRRGMALVKDYATRRVQFGAALDAKPLHVDTVAGMQAELEGAFHLAFLAAQLLGRVENGDQADAALMRLVTPIAKLTTAKQAVALASEALECFGGAGYVEDTGLPTLLRDAQVLPIWEGTTNVLSLDTLRALAKDGSLDAYAAFVKERLAKAKDPSLEPCTSACAKSLAHATEWLQANVASAEAGARRFALTLGRTLELALLVEHAQWCLDGGKGRRAAAAARRFAAHGVDLLTTADAADAALLAQAGSDR